MAAAPHIPHLRVDADRPLVDAPERGHNRWHPAIPPVLTVEPGAELTLDLRDGLDMQIRPGSTTDDVLALDVNRGHPMTGPVAVAGAEPGDLLDVEILDITPGEWGYTIVLPGLGLLGHRFDEPFVVSWDLRDGVARSPDMPGVEVPGAPFLGVIGVAPSAERLRAFAAREQALLDTGALVMPPDARAAVPASGVAATEGLRTVPPRENGGNMDVKGLTAGTTATFVVEVPGALFSVGDPHYAQGDGESCGVAIEMAATTTLRFGLRKAADTGWTPKAPAYEFTDSSGERCLATTGIGVAFDGTQLDLDVTVAARNALDDMVDQLVLDFGLTPHQAYVLVSVAADLRISEIVDVPNALVSAVLPRRVLGPARQRDAQRLG